MIRTEPHVVPVADAPLNGETPLRELLHERTPNPNFFIRSHFEPPVLDAASFRLEVRNRSGTSLHSLADLQALGHASVRVTLECAGNGRNRMRPVPPGTPWGVGAVGTAEFLGLPLHLLLRQIGIPAGSSEVLFVGADGDPGADPHADQDVYARSLPLDTALDPNVLLAWEMNGEPLPLHHGAPLRLIVPGWYAMASVKWLREIRFLDDPFQGRFQAADYVFLDDSEVPDRTPVDRMRVRSLICSPETGETVGAGTEIEIEGVAWSGGGGIARVELSTDGGVTWSAAAVAGSDHPFAARRWTARWTPEAPGEHRILARASDAAGAVQPLTPRWNRLGYANNACHEVRVRVV